MRVWILYRDSSATSYEREKILDFCQDNNIDLEVFEPTDFEVILNNDKDSLLVKGEKRALPDVLFPKLGAGTSYFAATIIREFERLGIPVVNSSVSIELAKDKLHSQQLLAKHGLPTPKTILMKHPVNVELIEKEIGFPCIIKCISGSQGKTVFCAYTRKEFKTQIEILSVVNENHNIIIQEFVKDSFGRDVRVYVLGGRPIAAMRRQAQEGEFKANITHGGSGTNFDLTPEVSWLAIEATKALGLDLAGVDLLFDGDSYKICEVNSNPGFSGLEKATGINIPQNIFEWLSIKVGS